MKPDDCEASNWSNWASASKCVVGAAVAGATAGAGASAGAGAGAAAVLIGGGPVECLQDVGFSFGTHLLLREDVSVRAIHGFDADDIFVVEAGDGAFEDGGALCALADFAGDFGSEMSVSRLAHQAERLLDALFGDDAQEGRLFELDGESLFESVVEDGVTGGVGEVGEDEGVGLREFGRVGGAVVEEAADGEERNQRGAGDHR